MMQASYNSQYSNVLQQTNYAYYLLIISFRSCCNINAYIYILIAQIRKYICHNDNVNAAAPAQW